MHFGQVRIKSVFTTHTLFPFQDEVRGGHRNHFSRISVECVLAWHKRRRPHALLPCLNQLAVLVIRTREILAPCACIGYHHTHIPNLHGCFRDQFHRRKQPIQEIGTIDKQLQLTAPFTTGLKKVFWILEIVVIDVLISHDRRNNLPLFQGRTIMYSDHPYIIVFTPNHNRRKPITFRQYFVHLIKQGFLI
jgi:hypothetical protein